MLTKCIYCQKSDNWSQEHCVPFGLGAFKNAHILNKTICRSCNTIISRSETQFLRSGPEAFFRQIIGVEGRKEHIKRSPFYYRSSGGSAIKLLCKHPTENYDILCEIDLKSKNAVMSNQIVFKNDKSEILQIPLVSEKVNEGMFKEPLFDKIIKNNYSPIFCCIENKNEDLLLKCLNEFFPKKYIKKVKYPTDTEKKQFTIEFRFTKHYFQTIAKIAFHYFLSVFALEFTGDEVEFEPIRSFIFRGKGNPSNFINQSDNQFIYDFNKGFIIKDWGHLLAVEKNSNYIAVQIQFFCGPKHLPPVFNILIGKNPQKIFCPENYGHFYLYYQNCNQGGFDGEVTAMQSIKIIQTI